MRPRCVEQVARDWWLCVASGPSLAREDLEALRWIGKKSIAVNTALFYAPWVGLHYAADDQWYKYYGWRSQPWYKGKRYGASAHRKYVEKWRPSWRWTQRGGNSGHHAIHLVAELGAKRIALIGYDHQHTNGERHVHGDHPSWHGMRMGNADPVHVWKKRMPATKADLDGRGVQIVNLTRKTAIQCIPRMTTGEFNARHKR